MAENFGGGLLPRNILAEKNWRIDCFTTVAKLARIKFMADKKLMLVDWLWTAKSEVIYCQSIVLYGMYIYVAIYIIYMYIYIYYIYAV